MHNFNPVIIIVSLANKNNRNRWEQVCKAIPLHTNVSISQNKVKIPLAHILKFEITSIISLEVINSWTCTQLLVITWKSL